MFRRKGAIHDAGTSFFREKKEKTAGRTPVEVVADKLQRNHSRAKLARDDQDLADLWHGVGKHVNTWIWQNRCATTVKGGGNEQMH